MTYRNFFFFAMRIACKDLIMSLRDNFQFQTVENYDGLIGYNYIGTVEYFFRGTFLFKENAISRMCDFLLSLDRLCFEDNHLRMFHHSYFIW